MSIDVCASNEKQYNTLR